ncbi:hypothetical protein [Adhaeretor mobilis]|uniref:PEP-CTERM protein-sorting domain-containing protein n=1 Tax=Adhaeretor mobilis TaxID=1930276 RepID=A0A517MW25_9BACT|nr:hypothetical protein [Adhaeretor mobilis]QDS99080.1 hypothetical protein HG15A2_23700 [Adhaeretor mobilis]
MRTIHAMTLTEGGLHPPRLGKHLLGIPIVPLLTALVVSVSMPGLAEAVIVDATTIEDTYLTSGSNTNYSGESTLQFRTFSSVWRNPLIQFDLPVLPAGEQVVQADLILTSSKDPTGSGGTPDIEVLATTTAIDMTTVTSVNSDPSLQTGGEAFTSALLWTGVWDDFSTESVIPGADFSVGQTVTYSDTDSAAGMLKFVKDNISESTAVTVNFGLGFTIREGNSGTTSAGWEIYSSNATNGFAPILRITTASVPEPSSFVVFSMVGLVMFGLRRQNRF